jgi:hypothetical protein
LASVGAGVKVNEPPEPPDEEPEPDDEPKLGAKGLRMPNPPPGKQRPDHGEQRPDLRDGAKQAPDHRKRVDNSTDQQRQATGELHVTAGDGRDDPLDKREPGEAQKRSLSRADRRRALR